MKPDRPTQVLDKMSRAIKREDWGIYQVLAFERTAQRLEIERKYARARG